MASRDSIFELGFYDHEGKFRKARINGATYQGILYAAEQFDRDTIAAARAAARKAEEEARRKARERNQRQAGEGSTYFSHSGPTFRGGPDSYYYNNEQFKEAWENLNAAFNGFTGERRYTQSPPRFYLPKPSTLGSRAQLFDLIGVEEGSLDIKVAYRRAKRLCHPDSGGSHEAWLELQSIARRLGLD